MSFTGKMNDLLKYFQHLILLLPYFAIGSTDMGHLLAAAHQISAQDLSLSLEKITFQ